MSGLTITNWYITPSNRYLMIEVAGPLAMKATFFRVRVSRNYLHNNEMLRPADYVSSAGLTLAWKWRVESATGASVQSETSDELTELVRSHEVLSRLLDQFDLEPEPVPVADVGSLDV